MKFKVMVTDVQMKKDWVEPYPNNHQVKIDIISTGGIFGKNAEDIVDTDLAKLVVTHGNTPNPKYQFTCDPSIGSIGDTESFIFSFWAEKQSRAGQIGYVPHRFGSGWFKSATKQQIPKQNAVAALVGYYKDHIKETPQESSKLVYEKWSPFLGNVQEFHKLGKQGKTYALLM